MNRCETITVEEEDNNVVGEYLKVICPVPCQKVAENKNSKTNRLAKYGQEFQRPTNPPSISRDFVLVLYYAPEAPLFI